MAILRSDLERALDDIISNEEGMRFQGIAVVLARQRWPDLIACERKKDLGADAIAAASLTSDGAGKVLACSLTATSGKIRLDAAKIKEEFAGISILIFATPSGVTNTTAKHWAETVQKEFGYELVVMPREDIITSLMEPANAPLCNSHLGMPLTLEKSALQLIGQAKAATSEVIATWTKRLNGKPFINLRAVKLSPDGRDTNEGFPLREIGAALTQSRRLVIEAPAGRGKTTTLAHLAAAHAKTSEGLAFVVDLPGWIKSKIGILQLISGMREFQSPPLTVEDLATLYKVQHFSFFLNGWNEIADYQSPEAVQALRDLDQQFSSAGILIATRAHHIPPPLPGAVRVRLLPLDRTQRTQYLRQRLGNRSSELRLRLDVDPILDDLTRTPLILSEVSSLFEANVPIPATKAGVISEVMNLLERSPEHSSHLQSAPLKGNAQDYLIALASEMTARGSVEIGEKEARTIVSNVSKDLRLAGQIDGTSEPSDLLCALCSHHVLERAEYPSVLFRFEHQQFQEFYAAQVVKRGLLDLVDNSSVAKGLEFMKTFINQPAWSVPIEMLAAELGDPNAGTLPAQQVIEASQTLVALTLDADLVYAAELFRLCRLPSPSSSGVALGERLRSLYKCSDHNFRQYALAGMLESGSDQFNDIILPLLTNEDQQVRVHTYRLRNGVFLSTLGSDWQQVVNGWDEDIRAEFFSELLHFGPTPYSLVPIVLADKSPKVRAVAIAALDWLGSDDYLESSLTGADDETFEMAIRALPLEFIPTTVHPRACETFRAEYLQSTDPFARLQILLKLAQLGQRPTDENLRENLNACDPQKLAQAWNNIVQPALMHLRNNDSKWVSDWIVERISNGAFWSSDWKIFVPNVPDELKQQFLRRLETEDFKHVRRAAFTEILLAYADDAMVQRVFAKLTQLNRFFAESPDQQHPFEYAIQTQLEDLCRALPASVVIGGLAKLLSDVVEVDGLAVVTRLFGRFSHEEYDLRGQMNDDLRQLLRGYLKRGAPLTLAEPRFAGEQKAHLITALAIVGDAEDFDTLRESIRADIDRLRNGQEARTKDPRARNASSGSYSNWNVRAIVLLDANRADSILLDLLKEPEYERDAATALLGLARNRAVQPSFNSRKDYQAIWKARTCGQSGEFDEARRQRYSLAIAEQIASIIKTSGETGQTAPYAYRLKELGKVLAILDSSNSASLLWQVLNFPGKHFNWPDVMMLESMLSSGIVFPTEATLAWFDRLVENIRPHRYDSQNINLLLNALCLLPFVDNPPAGIAKIRQTVADFGLGTYQLSDLTAALGHSRSAEAVPLLRSFISDDSDAKHLGSEWINALFNLNTSEARDLLLSFVDPELPELFPQKSFDWNNVLAARLAELAVRDAKTEQRLFEICGLNLPPSHRAMLARVVGNIGTKESMLAGLSLINDAVTPPVPYELWQQLESTFIAKKPSGRDSASYTPVPRSSNSVRQRVFDMARTDESRKKAAVSLLGQIELWRLKYERPPDEPRNPVLGTNFTWPPVTSLA